MNLFRILGDLSLFASKFILIFHFHQSESTKGVSFETQLLYLVVYICRWVHLVRRSFEIISKLNFRFFLYREQLSRPAHLSNLALQHLRQSQLDWKYSLHDTIDQVQPEVSLFRLIQSPEFCRWSVSRRRRRAPHSSENDSVNVEYLAVPCLALALVFNYILFVSLWTSPPMSSINPRRSLSQKHSRNTMGVLNLPRGRCTSPSTFHPAASRGGRKCHDPILACSDDAQRLLSSQLDLPVCSPLSLTRAFYGIFESSGETWRVVRMVADSSRSNTLILLQRIPASYNLLSTSSSLQTTRTRDSEN